MQNLWLNIILFLTVLSFRTSGRHFISKYFVLSVTLAFLVIKPFIISRLFPLEFRHSCFLIPSYFGRILSVYVLSLISDFWGSWFRFSWSFPPKNLWVNPEVKYWWVDSRTFLLKRSDSKLSLRSVSLRVLRDLACYIFIFIKLWLPILLI